MLEKIKLSVIVFLLLISTPALAWEDWDAKTKNSFIRSTNWIILDWHSTDMMAATGWDGIRETNIILGDNPSREKVAIFAMGNIGLNYWMHDRGWYKAAQIANIMHVYAAASNYNLIGEQDKILHVLAGSVVSEYVYSKTNSRLKSCAASLGVGILKESIDSFSHSFDVDDAIATGIGCSILTLEF